MKTPAFCLVLVIGLVFARISPLLADTLATPEPDFDNPRKIVLAFNEKDEQRGGAILNNIMNIHKAYGPEHVQLTLVVYGPGIWTVLKDSPLKERIQSIQHYEVEFIACQNTLDTLKLTDADLIDGVGTVRSGLKELVERRLSGWVDLKP